MLKKYSIFLFIIAVVLIYFLAPSLYTNFKVYNVFTYLDTAKEDLNIKFSYDDSVLVSELDGNMLKNYLKDVKFKCDNATLSSADEKQTTAFILYNNQNKYKVVLNDQNIKIEGKTCSIVEGQQFIKKFIDASKKYVK